MNNLVGRWLITRKGIGTLHFFTENEIEQYKKALANLGAKSPQPIIRPLCNHLTTRVTVLPQVSLIPHGNSDVCWRCLETFRGHVPNINESPARKKKLEGIWDSKNDISIRG